MIPDDCSDCRVCGVPVFGGTICIDCEPVRDDRGRFVDRATASRYRALVKTSRWLTGAPDDEVAEARRNVRDFFQRQGQSA